jgi:hypothetical protein
MALFPNNALENPYQNAGDEVRILRFRFCCRFIGAPTGPPTIASHNGQYFNGHYINAHICQRTLISTHI